MIEQRSPGVVETKESLLQPEGALRERLARWPTEDKVNLSPLQTSEREDLAGASGGDIAFDDLSPREVLVTVLLEGGTGVTVELHTSSHVIPGGLHS
jgi:hypothetical protein